MSATLGEECYENEAVVYMALELSEKRWKVCFGDGSRHRLVTVQSRDIEALFDQLARVREKWGLGPDCRVVSCYEAGRDGFWLHRCLCSRGVENRVVDSSSIEVSRRRRRAKTDRLDARALLRQLIRYESGESGVWSVVRVPSREDEDRQRLSRERERLVKECGAHSSRIRALLVTQGAKRIELRGDFEGRLERMRIWDGSALSAELKAELIREWRRREQVRAQIKELEAAQRARVEAAEEHSAALVRQLIALKGVGWQSAWVLVMELFAWRSFANRRQLAGCTGLAPTPYDSGERVREQGISKAGNRRVRRVLIELGWMWLRYQPDSEISRWFQRRFADQGKRARRVGIVAVARRLVIALWRYLQTGEIPAGAVLGTSR